MRTLVYVHRSRAAEALALVARLHGDGDTALYRDTRGYDGDIERCDLVVTDDAVVANAHHDAGIEVELFTPTAPVVVPDNIPAPMDTTTESEYRVTQNGTWFTLVGPDGEKVGSAQRSEAAALALIPER